MQVLSTVRHPVIGPIIKRDRRRAASLAAFPLLGGDHDMKIGISGASNCGKTTAARQIAKDMKLPMIQEGFLTFTNARKSAKSPMAMLQAHVDIITKKAALEKRAGVDFVADRTPIDVMMMFCTLQEPVKNAMPSSAVAAFTEQARENCRVYDYVVIPPWAVFTYHDPAQWFPATSTPKMNPWTNYSRHMMVHGIALDWIGASKVITPPAEIFLDGKISDWLSRRIDLPETDAEVSV